MNNRAYLWHLIRLQAKSSSLEEWFSPEASAGGSCECPILGDLQNSDSEKVGLAFKITLHEVSGHYHPTAPCIP